MARKVCPINRAAFHRLRKRVAVETGRASGKQTGMLLEEAREAVGEWLVSYGSRLDNSFA